MNELLAADLAALRPELWLTGAILAALVADLVCGRRFPRLSGLLCLAGVGGALLHLPGVREWIDCRLSLFGFDCCDGASISAEPMRVMGLLVLDGPAHFFRTLIIAATGFVVLAALVFRRGGQDTTARGEFPAMLLTAAVGGCLLVSADHLLMLFLGMEMLSLPSYVLAGWRKSDRRSSEAALKYLVYGALASGLMVFGFSLIYGLSGSLWLSDAAVGLFTAWESGSGEAHAAVVLAVTLVLAGIGFKIAAFPFHFWAPDVYEGAPTPVTAMLAVASKAAGFGVLLRFTGTVFLGGEAISVDWLERFSWMLAVLAAVTMTYGNITAVLQRNVKRLLAFSSIAHAGYLLMGVAVMTRGFTPERSNEALGLDATLFYLATYYVATLGAFGCVLSLSHRFGAEETDDYNGLGWSAPWTGAALVVFLVSLTGLPPTLGFIGKLVLFKAALSSGLAWLAVVAALNAVVALFYYFKLARALFLRGERSFVPGQRERGLLAVVAHASILLFAIATVWYGLFWDGIAEWVARSLG